MQYQSRVSSSFPGRLAVWLTLVLSAVLLSGCTQWPPIPRTAFEASEEPILKEAQACAIGYDLAREIHKRVSLKRTVLLASGQSSSCQRHTLNYLRRSGFQIDEGGKVGLGGAEFVVSVARIDAETVSATASIGGTLKISRSYRPVISGVVAASPPAILKLDPNTYTPRQDQKERAG